MSDPLIFFSLFFSHVTDDACSQWIQMDISRHFHTCQVVLEPTSPFLLSIDKTLTHFLWIIFLFLGALLGVKYKAIKIIHLSALCFAILMQAFDWYCPLTHLEFWLRSKYNPVLIYSGSFIIHYVEKIVYLEISRSLVFIFTVFLCVFNGWLYLKKTKFPKKVKRGNWF